MRLRTTAILATTAAASIALLAGCGGSASEATTSTATSTTVERKAAPLRNSSLGNPAVGTLGDSRLGGPSWSTILEDPVVDSLLGGPQSD